MNVREGVKWLSKQRKLGIPTEEIIIKYYKLIHTNNNTKDETTTV